MLLPRSVYDAKPTAESPNAIVNTPGVFVGTFAVRADATADPASVAASSRNTTRFTGEPSSGPGSGTGRGSRGAAEASRAPEVKRWKCATSGSLADISEP